MKRYLTALLIGLSAIGIEAKADQLKVAVADTGLDLEDPRFHGVLCPDPEDHRNFVAPGNKMKDLNGHGTVVAGIIVKEAGRFGDYCLMILKYWSDSNPGAVNARNLVKALRYAAARGASIVNYSGGGESFSEDEFLAIKDNPDITFVVAAGNEGKDISLIENYFYPASYRLPNIIPVGATGLNKKRLPSSNHGARVEFELGEETGAWLPEGRVGEMSGSSMATARRTGKLIRAVHLRARTP